MTTFDTGIGVRRPTNAFRYGSQGPVWVYRHLSETGETLYIGATGQPEQRQPTHRRSSPWWPLIAEIVYHGPYTSDDAFTLERQLIADEQPPFNVQGTGRGRGRLPKARTVDLDEWCAEHGSAEGGAA